MRHVVSSRLSVGRSDAVVLPHDVIDDDALTARLALQNQSLLVRVSFRMSFRPTPGELFERALFAVELVAQDAQVQPFARALRPERLAAGPYKITSSTKLGFRTSVPGLELNAERSTAAAHDTQPAYVVAAGVGESDPEWRYIRTDSMMLEGSHEMSLVAEIPRSGDTYAVISAEATVAFGRRRTDIAWELPRDIERVRLPTD